MEAGILILPIYCLFLSLFEKIIAAPPAQGLSSVDDDTV